MSSSTLERYGEPDEYGEFQVDLRAASFDAIAAFVFDHPAPGSDDDTPWYSEASFWLTVEPAVQVAFLSRLFNDPEHSFAPYSDAQVNTGFWYMFAFASRQWFLAPLWDATVAWADRSACWAAFPSLYRRFLAARRLDVAFMLPQLLADGKFDWSQRDVRVAGHEQTAHVFVAALRELLTEPDDASRMAALHGLNHLREYEGAMSAVRDFLETTAAAPGEVQQYARDVLQRAVL